MPQPAFLSKLATPSILILSTVPAAFLLWFIQVAGLPFIPGFHAILHIGLPDMMLTYAPASLHEKLMRFGPDGRIAYQLFLTRVDSIFPLIYGLFFLSATAFGLTRSFPHRTVIHQLSFLALGTSLFDYAENFCFLLLLRVYPGELPTLEKLANTLTLIKWVFAALNFVLLFCLAFVLLFRAFRRVPASPAP